MPPYIKCEPRYELLKTLGQVTEGRIFVEVSQSHSYRRVLCPEVQPRCERRHFGSLTCIPQYGAVHPRRMYVLTKRSTCPPAPPAFSTSTLQHCRSRARGWLSSTRRCSRLTGSRRRPQTCSRRCRWRPVRPHKFVKFQTDASNSGILSYYGNRVHTL